MSDSEGEPALALDSIFTEPPRPPSPAPTLAVYEREQPSQAQYRADVDAHNWTRIEIQLVGSHPLWGHHLWNASRAFATFLDAQPALYRDRAVLELGAGGGLPGIVCALNGARSVVLTDYPDAPLLANIVQNVHRNVPPPALARVAVQGHVWGKPVKPLLDALGSRARGFDLIIMSDLIFNHSQHDALLSTAELALAGDAPGDSSEDAPAVLVFYTHHRPHLAQRDMEFFEKARARGWRCIEIVTQRFPPMFPEDPGAEEVRATVHGWRLMRAQ